MSVTSSQVSSTAVPERYVWCAVAGQAKVFQVDLADCDVIYDLKKAVVNASKIKIPYFKVEIWKPRYPKQWPVDDKSRVRGIPNDFDGLRKIARRLYVHERLDGTFDEETTESVITIIMEIRSRRKDLPSISVPERRVWCAVVGTDHIFQVDIAKCVYENDLLKAIARDVDMASYMINDLWKVKEPSKWPVNDGRREQNIPKTKEELREVAVFLKFKMRLEDNMFDDELREEHIYLFAKLKEKYTVPRPTLSNPDTLVWCAVAGRNRVFQVDIGRCDSMMNLILDVEERSGFKGLEGRVSLLWKTKNPQMWPVLDTEIPEIGDEFPDDLDPVEERDSIDTVLNKDLAQYKDNIYLVLEIPTAISLLSSEPPEWYVWCVIGHQNYVCRLNIGGYRVACDVSLAIQRQENFQLVCVGATTWKMNEPQKWPVKDVVKGLRRVPNDTKRLRQIAFEPLANVDLDELCDEEVCEDHICFFIQLPDDMEPSSPSSEESNPLVEREDVRTALRDLGFLENEVFVTLDRRHVGHVFTAEEHKEYIVKYLHPGRCNEIDVVEYLTCFDLPQNHSPPEVISRHLDEGAILLTPYLGRPVAKYKELSRDLLSVVRQLFEGVAFLHSKRIAHMDLKPSHIITDRSGTLWIVDYDLSKILKEGEETVKGFRGTEGYTAPEVGPKPYNTFLADVWAAGRVVRELCDLCPDHQDHDFLIRLCERLMVTDPQKRPSMSEAYDDIAEYMTSTVQ